VDLNWTTFFLEIINFLVLVWILKRFLYKPVLEAISQRKVVIDRTLADAKAKEARAQALGEQYQNRLSDWENEKEKLRAVVVDEIRTQRAQMTAALENSLKEGREKARVLEDRRLKELQNKSEEAGVARGVQFTARLLARMACPELEARLVNLLLEDLPLLSDEQKKALRSVCRQAGLQVKVSSAFPLSASQRSVITEKLKEVTEDSITLDFNEDSGLVAGLRVSIGPWVLRANLRDELAFFAGVVGNDSRAQ
jgi:F-type H+-transporting ATPase subunit b